MGPKVMRSRMGARDHRTLDCESAVLLRGWLFPLFDRAKSWAGLEKILEAKGYALECRNGQFCLAELSGGRRVCTLRSLGAPVGDLMKRLGRPVFRPIPNRPAAGRISIGTRAVSR